MKDKNLIFHQNFQQFNQVKIVNYDIINQTNAAAEKVSRQTKSSIAYDNLKTPKADGARISKEIKLQPKSPGTALLNKETVSVGEQVAEKNFPTNEMASNTSISIRSSLPRSL